MSQIVNFNLFGNSGDKAAELKFKKFSKDAAGATVSEDVVATYRVSNTDNNVVGSGLKDVTANSNVIRKISIGIKGADGKVTKYYNGALFESKNKKSEKAPDFFGTAQTKGDQAEYQLAGWLKEDKNGAPYISVSLSEPYVAPAAADVPTTAPATAGGALDDDIPF